MHRINLDGTVQVGTMKIHPEVHALATRYLNSHFGEPGTESKGQLDSMRQVVVEAQPYGYRRTESRLENKHKPVNKPVLSDAMTHMIMDRFVDRIHGEKNPKLRGELMRRFGGTIYHSSDFKLSKDQQHKLVDSLIKTTSGDLNHYDDTENFENIRRPVSSSSITNSTSTLFSKHITDEEPRMRLHDHLDKMEASGDPKRMELGRVLRGHMVTSSVHAKLPEMMRMWNGLANNSDYADTESVQAYHRRQQMVQRNEHEDILAGKDIIQKSILLNARPVEQLILNHNTSSLSLPEKVKIAAHAYHLIDNHPNMKKFRGLTSEYIGQDDFETAMFGTAYWKRKLAESVGDAMRGAGHPDYKYSQEKHKSGKKMIEDHMARTNLTNRI